MIVTIDTDNPEHIKALNEAFDRAFHRSLPEVFVNAPEIEDDVDAQITREALVDFVHWLNSDDAEESECNHHCTVTTTNTNPDGLHYLDCPVWQGWFNRPSHRG